LDSAFISKISIVIEEADESEFWLEFIMEEKMMKKEMVLPLFNEAHELSSVFIITRKTAQTKKTIDNQQSTINNQQSTIQEVFWVFQSSINNQQSTIPSGNRKL